ncbi:TPA: argininosuccinate lyase [Candidatus Nomurabacteria bacterium]|nr:argininosuccinate lyase [Candidatus Nomurabacteria bacterium]
MYKHMTKIWQKSKSKSNTIIEKYNTGDDFLMDMEIFTFDILASIAHAEMLGTIGILNKEEVKSLVLELNNILKSFNDGKIKIRVEDEDCHTVIENLLIKKLGNVGKKIHTGRSRNDQVLTAVRLYTVNKLRIIATLNKDLTEAIISFAEKNKNSPLPGYTHTQQAMLSSFGHWSLSFVEGLINDQEILNKAIEINNQNPLGTAAGFGVSFPLDREYTRKKLNFDKNIINSLFAQASRGKFESLTLESLSQIMLTLSRFATDMLFFTARETGFVKVSESLTTGSSIMPQKKNLDSMELIRGNASIIFSNQLAVKNIPKGVISGYNRDLQLIKKPLIESLNIVQSSLEVVHEFIKGIEIDKDAVKIAIKKDIFAADMVNEMVEKDGISFRDAYVKVGQALDEVKDFSLEKNIISKKSLGSPGNLDLNYYKKILKKL